MVVTQQREAITDRLVSIIATIKMERQSGQLRVWRGEGLTAEEGILTFMQGQIKQASVGRRSGADALNWLSTWGRTHYLFLSARSELEERVLRDIPALPATSSGSEEKHTDRLDLESPVHTDRLDLESPIPSDGETPCPYMKFHEAMKQIEKAGLSRAHRRLYLLIDGRRSIHDLASLLGKERVEVRSLLCDLEWERVIHFNDSSPEY